MEIKPYEKNAKKHPKKQIKALAEIIKEVGWRQPVLVNHETGVIVAGHGRWMTWKEYGEKYELKPIWVINDKGETINGGPETKPMTEQQEIAYRLADNKLNESEWDMILVKDDLKALDLEMLDKTGFNRDLIIDQDENDDVVPEDAPNESKLGDLYELGEHRLLCGDSTSQEAFSALFKGNKADMVFTDPPYNVNYKGKGEKTSNTIMNDSMSDEKFDEFLKGAFQRLSEISKDGAGWYVFHSSSTQDQFRKTIEDAGWRVKTQIIWNKPTASMGWGDYRMKHEPMFYCGKENTVFYGDRTGTSVWDFQKTEQELVNWAKIQKRLEKDGRTTIWTMKRENVNGYVHPTQKPVELIQYALFNSSKAGDIVVDPFLGSGSTLIAAQKTNRVCYGLELDPRYVDTIIQRWCDYTGTYDIIKNGKEMTWQKKTKE